jgi:Xaa-Pro aminopeptidase
MAHDPIRNERIRQGLREANLDALVCSLPTNVLLLTGYWPVVGTAVAIATRDGPTIVLAPQDECDLAERSGADEVRAFQTGSLEEIRSATLALHQPLVEVGKTLRIGHSRVGHEAGPAFQPASYASMHLYGVGLKDLLDEVWPSAALVPSDELLARLRTVKTPQETESIRKACRIAEGAFREGARQTAVGEKETEAAAHFRQPLQTEGIGFDGVARAGGFIFCMSGVNAAEAFGAYARSRDKHLARQELALVHCNSNADGYWTDITRTYCLGPPDARQRAWYEAIFTARAAALAAIRPGARASAVDRAAREVLQARGFGEAFKHPTGHGVGFAAINHNARPRIRPRSDEILETGMVFNVEPGIYVDGYGGLRHCDMVAVTQTGVEVLTPFQAEPEQLTLGGS